MSTETMYFDKSSWCNVMNGSSPLTTLMCFPSSVFLLCWPPCFHKCNSAWETNIIQDLFSVKIEAVSSGSSFPHTASINTQWKMKKTQSRVSKKDPLSVKGGMIAPHSTSTTYFGFVVSCLYVFKSNLRAWEWRQQEEDTDGCFLPLPIQNALLIHCPLYVHRCPLSKCCNPVQLVWMKT